MVLLNIHSQKDLIMDRSVRKAVRIIEQCGFNGLSLEEMLRFKKLITIAINRECDFKNGDRVTTPVENSCLNGEVWWYEGKVIKVDLSERSIRVFLEKQVYQIVKTGGIVKFAVPQIKQNRVQDYKIHELKKMEGKDE
jgi:hypothetical protein